MKYTVCVAMDAMAIEKEIRSFCGYGRNGIITKYTACVSGGAMALE